MSKYWVGGTGTWNTTATTHWSDSSGGAPGAAVPTVSDDVVFDALSGSDNYTVTLSGGVVCKNLTIDKPTGVGKKVTWAGSSSLAIYGSLNLLGGTAGITRTYTGAITFKSTSTGQTISLNSVTLASAITFDGVGGGWTLSNALTATSITLTNGAFSTGNQNITLSAAFNSTNSNIRSLTLGSSSISCTAFSIATSTNLTFDAGTSIITCSGSSITFAGSGKTFYEVRLTGASPSITGANSFTNLTITGTAVKTGVVSVKADQIITGTLTINGNTSVNRVTVNSDVVGTPRTLTTTGGSVVVSNADFRDIDAVGDAGDLNLSAVSGGSGDCGGNTGITFTSPQDWYFHAAEAGANSWSTIGKWFTQTNGAGSVATRPPLPQDTCHFDVNSFDAGGITVTQDMPRVPGFTLLGATNNPTFTFPNSWSCFGSMILIAAMSLTAGGNGPQFRGRGNYILDYAGLAAVGTIQFDAPTGELKLASDLSIDETHYLWVYHGTFTCINGANNYVLSVGYLYVYPGGILNLGSATHLIIGTADAVLVCSGTINAGTSTLKLCGALIGNITFSGGGQDYYNVWFSTTNAFNNYIEGVNTYNDLRIDAGRNVGFWTPGTHIMNSLTALGTAEARITLRGLDYNIILEKAGGGIITGCDYITVSYLEGSPLETWYVGDNSVDGGNTSGFYFSDQPLPPSQAVFFGCEC